MKPYCWINVILGLLRVDFCCDIVLCFKAFANLIQFPEKCSIVVPPEILSLDLLISISHYIIKFRQNLHFFLCILPEWGLMQIMGTNLRSLGYDGSLIRMAIEWQKCLDYSVKFLKILKNRYPLFEDTISSWNQGSPHKQTDGSYMNQSYIDSVKKHYLTASI